MKTGQPQTLLVLSPTLTGGSWIVIEDLLKKIPCSTKIIIVGLGPGKAYSNAKLIRIPYFLFDNLRSSYGANIFFNIFYQIPLLLISLASFIIYKPQKVLSNGFTPILLTMFLGKVVGSRNIVYYGSVVEGKFDNPLIYHLFKKLNYFIDFVFVNSKGSFTDISLIINSQKIITIEHWTDITAVSETERIRLRRKMKIHKKFIILYVGKLAPDKSCDFFITLATSFAEHWSIEFWFAGAGSLLGEIQNIADKCTNIKYLGFVKNREKLKMLYSIADLTLTFADETYLARPAIESLACGTPIIVSDRPAIIEKANKVKIPPKLVPAKIGWIVDASNLSKSADLITKIFNKKMTSKRRKFCINYSKKKYSWRNIIPALEKIS